MTDGLGSRGLRLVGVVEVVRVSPDGHKMARIVPEEVRKPGTPQRWLAVWFAEFVGLTVELLTDDQVAGWTEHRLPRSSGIEVGT